MRKQIFLFGFPRSGTTLIRSRISQHPDINLVNEPEIIFGLRNAGYNTNDQINITGEILQQLVKIVHCKNHLDKLDTNMLMGYYKMRNRCLLRRLTKSYCLNRKKEKCGVKKV